MYKDNSQLRIEDFVFPYGKLDPENDWVRLAALAPWVVVEERYVARFVNNGRPVHPVRMALGALLIQRRLKCNDQWLVKHIGENPYLQYFSCANRQDRRNPGCTARRTRRDSLRLSKSKKRSGKTSRSAIRKQLQYIRRDMCYIDALVQKGTKLSSKQADRLNVVTTVYEQQRIMFASGTYSIPHCVVSLAQPWANLQKIRICPIKRRNRSIRTAAATTLWRVLGGQSRPFMVWTAS